MIKHWHNTSNPFHIAALEVEKATLSVSKRYCLKKAVSCSHIRAEGLNHSSAKTFTSF